METNLGYLVRTVSPPIPPPLPPHPPQKKKKKNKKELLDTCKLASQFFVTFFIFPFGGTGVRTMAPHLLGSHSST
jgi:hypothetical protein